MASVNYCSNVAGELEGLSEKLHNLSEKIERLPSLDKYKLQPHIDELHIIMTELDDRLCELVNSCSTAETFDTNEAKEKTGVSFSAYPGKNELFDYDIGG